MWGIWIEDVGEHCNWSVIDFSALLQVAIKEQFDFLDVIFTLGLSILISGSLPEISSDP